MDTLWNQANQRPLNLDALWPMGSEPDLSGIDPRQPTHYRPGTLGKMLVLRARYRSGLALWHVADAGHEESVAGSLTAEGFR